MVRSVRMAELCAVGPGEVAPAARISVAAQRIRRATRKADSAPMRFARRDRAKSITAGTTITAQRWLAHAGSSSRGLSRSPAISGPLGGWALLGHQPVRKVWDGRVARISPGPRTGRFAPFHRRTCGTTDTSPIRRLAAAPHPIPRASPSKKSSMLASRSGPGQCSCFVPFASEKNRADAAAPAPPRILVTSRSRDRRRDRPDPCRTARPRTPCWCREWRRAGS